MVFRMGLASSRSEARQLVRHKQVLVGGKIVNIPSYRLKAGSAVELTEAAKQHLRVKAAVEAAAQKGVSEWLDVDLTKMQGIVRALPSRDQLDPGIREQLIVELYSK